MTRRDRPADEDSPARRREPAGVSLLSQTAACFAPDLVGGGERVRR